MWVSKKKYEELVGRIEVIERRLTKFRPYHIDKFNRYEDDIERLQRIVENYIPREVTYVSKDTEVKFKNYLGIEIENEGTRIYKDGKEYMFHKLYLHNKAKIEMKDDNKNILYIEDKYMPDGLDTYVTGIYIVDLQNQTFIRKK